MKPKTRTRFYYKSQPVAGNQTEPLSIGGTMFCVLSSTGTVEMSFNGGEEWMPLTPIGWELETVGNEVFDKIWFRSTAGGSVSFYYGFGHINAATSSGSGGGTDNVSGHGSPVGVVTPDAINQFYTDVDTPALWQATGITNADWRQWI
jgi:hypothetical protein